MLTFTTCNKNMEHVSLHNLTSEQQKKCQFLHSTTFGIWLLNYCDGYLLKGVVDPQHLLFFNIAHVKTQDQGIGQDEVVQSNSGSVTFDFFERVYESSCEKLFGAIQKLCQGLSSSCNCEGIVRALAQWDFTIFGKKKQQVRQYLITEIYKNLHKKILDSETRNMFLPDPVKLFQIPQKDGHYFCQWTYGVLPCIYLCNVYKKMLDHFPEKSAEVSDWWIFLSNFTAEQCLKGSDLDRVFVEDSKIWKEQFKNAEIWSDTWIPSGSRDEPWLVEIDKLGFVNQNENLWSGKPAYAYLCTDSLMIFQVQIVVTNNDVISQKIEKVARTRAWENSPVLFYRVHSQGPLEYPFNETWIIRNDGLICIINANTTLHVIGVLRSKKVIDCSNEDNNNNNNNSEKHLYLFPCTNKFI
jgi:hypothetical protein